MVRVGGGWEYLYDFLFKADPCRGKWKTLTSCEVSSSRMATNFRKKIVITLGFSMAPKITLCITISAFLYNILHRMHFEKTSLEIWFFINNFFILNTQIAKQAMESGSQEMQSLNLSGLDLTPIDKKSAEFNLNVTRMTPKSWTPYRNRYERSSSLGSAASSDNIDYDESSDSISLSTSTAPSTPSSRPSSRIEYTPSSRKSSASSSNNNNESKLLGSLATMNTKNNKRLSLIERQAIYAEKKKVAQAYEDNRKI